MYYSYRPRNTQLFSKYSASSCSLWSNMSLRSSNDSISRHTGSSSTLPHSLPSRNLRLSYIHTLFFLSFYHLSPSSLPIPAANTFQPLIILLSAPPKPHYKFEKSLQILALRICILKFSGGIVCVLKWIFFSRTIFNSPFEEILSLKNNSFSN